MSSIGCCIVKMEKSFTKVIMYAKYKCITFVTLKMIKEKF